MGKKNNPNIDLKENTNNITDTDIIEKSENIIKQETLEDLDIQGLISLQEGCALLCKRYETIAQLDINNNALFKEYQGYYEMILKELGKRITKYCKKT